MCVDLYLLCGILVSVLFYDTPAVCFDMVFDVFEPQIFVCDCHVRTTPVVGEMRSLLQMPGLVVIKSGLANLPNVWPYNMERFATSELGVQLQMCNKLVVKAKKSVFFVIANGPRPEEQLVHWEVHVANVKKHLRQHEDARTIVQAKMYKHCGHFNGHA